MKHLMFIGKMCSGKTTFAKALENYQVMSLADPIKAVVWKLGEEELTSLLEEHIFSLVSLTDVQKEKMYKVCRETLAIKPTPPKNRERLQYFGTDGGRDQVDKNIWIRCLMSRVKKSLMPVAVDDCRFVNEFDAMKETFFPIILRVSKENQHKRLTNLYGNYDKKILQHASEAEFGLIDAKAREIPHLEINSNYPVETVLPIIREKIREL